MIARVYGRRQHNSSHRKPGVLLTVASLPQLALGVDAPLCTFEVPTPSRAGSALMLRGGKFGLLGTGGLCSSSANDGGDSGLRASGRSAATQLRFSYDVQRTREWEPEDDRRELQRLRRSGTDRRWEASQGRGWRGG
ncbi:hypothetical protein PUNSTDRAFT_49747, partial [Punctularia strigosozonata HHB-11173 SS5]|uniref:uncharacterized protein n=1 Tax=Punctularia strigosozonata (strain HHB-11173) TaxID=741275 RepID=UPI0004417651